MRWMKFSLMVIGVVLALAFLRCPVFHAMPKFMEWYDADPYAKAELRGRCTVCHVSESGFGPLTVFGRAFAENDYRITEELRAQFPDVFTLGGQAGQSTAQAKAAVEPEFKVEEFYAANCALCHGNDGRGGANPVPVPDFTSPAWQKERTDQELIEVISNGKGLMPAWKGKLTESQIKALVAFIRKLGEQK
ncbi:MAG: c-type cytochrome [Thermofilaceae archaeon]